MPTCDSQEIEEELARRRNQQVVIQTLKEDIIDAVNDLKGKPDIWHLDGKQIAQCDTIIKKMVFNARESDHVAHVYDLVRGLFDVMRDVLKSTSTKSIKKDEVISEIKESKTDSELKMVKNLEIVIDVFKKAAERIGKVGERDWREVIEQ